MTRKPGKEIRKEVGIAENSTYIYKEGKSQCKLDDDPGIADLLESARRVLKSGNQVAFDALERNIWYFDYAIKIEGCLNSIDKTIKRFMAKIKDIKQSSK